MSTQSWDFIYLRTLLAYKRPRPFDLSWHLLNWQLGNHSFNFQKNFLGNLKVSNCEELVEENLHVDRLENTSLKFISFFPSNSIEVSGGHLEISHWEISEEETRNQECYNPNIYSTTARSRSEILLLLISAEMNAWHIF